MARLVCSTRTARTSVRTWAKGAFEVWRHKRFASRPALAAGDGPIGLYRQWTRQFYAASPTA
jgi:hypothetical protein